MKNFGKKIKIFTLGAVIITLVLFVKTDAVQASNFVKHENLNFSGAVKKTKGLSYTAHKTRNGVACIVKNTKSYAVNIDAQIIYYNKRNKMVGTKSDYNSCLEPKKTCVLFFYYPTDSDYRTVTYKKSKINFKVEKASKSVKYGSKHIKIKANKTNAGVTAEFTNTSKKKFSWIHATIVYYDKKSKVIGIDGTYVDCEKPKSKDYVKFNFPYDSNYKTIKPKKYKIYIDYAYYYNW